MTNQEADEVSTSIVESLWVDIPWKCGEAVMWKILRKEIEHHPQISKSATKIMDNIEHELSDSQTGKGMVGLLKAWADKEFSELD